MASKFFCPTCGQRLSTMGGKPYCRRCKKNIALKDALMPDPKKYDGGGGGFSNPKMRRSTSFRKGGPNPSKKKKPE